MNKENQEILWGLDEIHDRVCKYCKVFLDADETTKNVITEMSILPTFLFYGLPGTGKTTLANKIYNDLKKDFNIDMKRLRMDQLISSNFGESSQNLWKFFDDLQNEQSENASKTFVIIDEIDSFALSRMQNNNESVKRILLTFNTIIDDLINKGTINDLVIVATTNVKDSIDPAVLRRFYFEENFDIKVEKAGFCEYIEKLNDIVEVFQKNDERILSGLYEVYSEKKFTLGEIKRIISRYYMKLKIENDGNREEICEYFEKQKSFSEIIQEQIKQKEE